MPNPFSPLARWVGKLGRWVAGGEPPDRVKILGAWCSVARFLVWRWWNARKLAAGAGSTSATPGIRLIIFFCSADAELLYMSLATLARLAPRNLGVKQITLYEDPANPADAAMRQRLLEFPLPLKMDRLPHRHVGVARLFNALETYALAAREAAPGDWIMRGEGDLLWVNDRFLRHVLSSSADLVGHLCVNYRELTGFLFAQGGCYALRAETLPRLVAAPWITILAEEGPRLLPHYPIYMGCEDALMTLGARHAGLREALDFEYLESPDDPNPRGSLMHFEGREKKRRMPDFFAAMNARAAADPAG